MIEKKIGALQLAVQEMKRFPVVVGETARHLMSAPLFVRCPHCICTISIPPPAPRAEQDEADQEEMQLPAALQEPRIRRINGGYDRRVMACPHCGKLFRVPSTVMWEQIVYVGARLRMAVFAFWDKTKNTWAYMFKKQRHAENAAANDPDVKSRAMDAAVSSKVWTEKNIASVYNLFKLNPRQAPEELIGADLIVEDVQMEEFEEKSEDVDPVVVPNVEPLPPAPPTPPVSEPGHPEAVPEPEAVAEPVEEDQFDFPPEPEPVEPQGPQSPQFDFPEPEPVAPQQPQDQFIFVDEPTYQTELETLASMGFLDIDRNLCLLKAKGLQQTIDILLADV